MLGTVWGRKIGTARGFKYSSAISGLKSQSWNFDNLNQYLENPQGFASGNAMAFAGVKNA